MIMGEAFRGCNLSEIDLPSIEYLGKFAFSYNKELKSCNLGNKLKTIDIQVFRDCSNLPTITIPETVTFIGEMAFYGCENLSIVTAKMKKPAEINNGQYGSFENKHLQTLFVPEEAYDAYMASDWNQYPLAKEGGKSEFDVFVEKPGTLLSIIGMDNVPSIKHLKLTGIIDDKDMDIIRQMVNLQSVDLENCFIIESKELKEKEKSYNNFLTGLANLADEAAQNAYQRKEITSGRYQKEQIINAMVRASAQNEAEIDGSIIFSKVFTGLKFLETVILPKNTKLIAHHAFANCIALKQIKMSNCLETAGDNAFENCVSLESVQFPSLKKLGDLTFKGCSKLSNISLPEGLQSIDESAFLDCSQLKNITIPSTVRKMGNLLGNTGVGTQIHCKGEEAPILKDKDSYFSKKYKIFVPKGSSTSYYNAWGKLNIVEE